MACIICVSTFIIFPYLLALTQGVSILESRSKSTILLPNEEKLLYVGRMDFSEPLAPAFSWVMTGMKVSFSGTTSISGNFTTSADHARLRVIIDGKTNGFVKTKGKTGIMASYELATGLTRDTHTLEVYKVTEDNSQKGSKGEIKFGGFVIDDKGSFGPAPSPLSHRLEFIGDSDTCGWCADGSPTTGDNPNTYEDGYETWAQQIARTVGAEPMVEAVSGWGVTSKSTPIQSILDNTNGFNQNTKWNYTSWTPDAVVMLIGPNDELYSSKNFIKSYLELMNMVAKNYAHAIPAPKIIHVCGGSINGLDPCDDIQTANNEFNQQSGVKIKGFYTSITKEHWKMINTASGHKVYKGCDSHYNTKGHAVLAEDIVPQLKKIMGW